MIKERERRVERRKHPRVKGDFGIEIADQKSRIIANTINISASGIYCQSDCAIPLFREISIRIKLPKSTYVIECSGVIVRCEKVPGKERYHLAIFLSDISQKDKKLLSSYIEKTLAETTR